MQIKIATDYSPKFLQVERPKPLSDRYIESEIQEILHGNWSHDISDQVSRAFFMPGYYALTKHAA